MSTARSLGPSPARTRAISGTAQVLSSSCCFTNRLVYLDDVDPTQLVIEGPGGSTTINLGEEGDLIEIHPAGQALLETAVKGRVLVADLNAHTARAITVQLPPGWTEMTHARSTSDGRLYLAMRDSAVGYLEVSSDGLSWTPVGLPIGEVFGAAARESNGTFYLYGDINSFTIPPWDPPSGAARARRC